MAKQKNPFPWQWNPFTIKQIFILWLLLGLTPSLNAQLVGPQTGPVDGCEGAVDASGKFIEYTPLCGGIPCTPTQLRSTLCYWDIGTGEQIIDEFPVVTVLDGSPSGTPTVTSKLKTTKIYQDAERTLPPPGSGASFSYPTVMPLIPGNGGEFTCDVPKWPISVANPMTDTICVSTPYEAKIGATVKYVFRFANPNTTPMIRNDIFFKPDEFLLWVGDSPIYPHELRQPQDFPFTVLMDGSPNTYQQVTSPYNPSEFGVEIFNPFNSSVQVFKEVTSGGEKRIRFSIDIQPKEIMSVVLEFVVDPSINGVKEFISNEFALLPDVPLCGNDNMTQFLRESLDPNYKIILVNGKYMPEILAEIECGDTIYYLVHFENEGAGEATLVKVVDNFDPHLIDHSTITVQHVETGAYGPLNEVQANFPANTGDYTVQVNGNSAVVTLNLKNAPLASTNNPNVEDRGGYLIFCAVTTCPPGHCDSAYVLCNDADIYFDSNPPITTNSVCVALKNTQYMGIQEICLSTACTPNFNNVGNGYLSVIDYTDGAGNICPTGGNCLPCSGGLTAMTLSYDGPCPVMIKVTTKVGDEPLPVTTFEYIKSGQNFEIFANDLTDGLLGHTTCFELIPISDP